MQFNSVVYAVFLVLVFGAYWALARKPVRLQNLLVLVASYVFYGWWDWRFLSLIFVSSLADFLVGRALGQTEDARRRKTLLGMSLALNLGILGFFKYFDFFIESFAALLASLGFEVHAPTLRILLPVGISFYTFQTLSYTIDIYRRKIQPTKDIVAFFAFVAFFPQLVAGPIERAKSLLPQFERRRVFSSEQAVSGLRIMLWGYVKKIVIADRLAPLVEAVYGNPEVATGPSIVLATLAFTLQVYGDFSGYSDIAIGSARLFGIELMWNFRTPYFSTSLQELWQRWHISLSTWFRDYVYIPLGGSRVGALRRNFNVIATFTISGLWHGAAWPFVLWGFIHGVGFAVEDAGRRYVAWTRRIPAWLGWFLMFAFFNFALLLFRSSNLHDMGVLLSHLGTFESGATGAVLQEAYGSGRAALYVLLSVVLFLAVELRIGRADVNRVFRGWPWALRWAGYYALILWILLLGDLDNAPEFIYFQF